MNNKKLRFPVLVMIVSISGLSQGMLLPLIAVILEQQGVSPVINGLHATGLYIGILLASPFMETPLRRFGYKPLIIAGGFTVVISLFLFTVWESVILWFILRLIIGIGDHALHFASQTWITSFSSADKRGRNISLYGLSFGVGFAVGPLLTQLVQINENLPFIITGILSLFACLTIFLIKNEYPDTYDHQVETYSIRSTVQRFGKVVKYAWAPLLPAFCYGVLEASLNGNFPVYGLRLGHGVEILSIIVSAFAVGGIVFQLPLGMLSDKFGRRNILRFVMIAGFFIFGTAGIFEHSSLYLLFAFFTGGMLLGSTYSLSIAFLTDTIPKQLLPAGNLLVGICFSFGSITGPFLSGLVIDLFKQISFFYFIAVILLFIFTGLHAYKKDKQLSKADPRWNI